MSTKLRENLDNVGEIMAEKVRREEGIYGRRVRVRRFFDKRWYRLEHVFKRAASEKPTEREGEETRLGNCIHYLAVTYNERGYEIEYMYMND